MSNSEVIRVDGLTKVYPEVIAVNHVSFRVSRGEVVGFLGPNGAGKTTTLKMLTCFMPATRGHAWVNGHDVVTQPLHVRRSIGYLPEANALYEEMRVAEYLRFRASLKRVRWSQRKKNVARAIELCSLGHMAQRTIGHLSKGYRQRVGLADALVGDPPVLILDEPTSGLDPRQIVGMRELIKELSKDKTILLSTHYLGEVEQICDRVLIIDRGKLILDSKLSDIQEQDAGTLEAVFMRLTAADVPRDVSTLAASSERQRNGRDSDKDDAKRSDSEEGT